MTNIGEINGLTLAYLGDAVIEERVRLFLVRSNNYPVNQLNKVAKSYVSAKAQAAFYDLMVEQKVLNDDELDAFRLGRNAKSSTHAKNTNVITYRISTGFEAIFGYLKFTNKNERIDSLMNFCFTHLSETKFKN